MHLHGLGSEVRRIGLTNNEPAAQSTYAFVGWSRKDAFSCFFMVNTASTHLYVWCDGGEHVTLVQWPSCCVRSIVFADATMLTRATKQEHQTSGCFHKVSGFTSAKQPLSVYTEQ